MQRTLHLTNWGTIPTARRAILKHDKLVTGIITAGGGAKPRVIQLKSTKHRYYADRYTSALCGMASRLGKCQGELSVWQLKQV